MALGSFTFHLGIGVLLFCLSAVFELYPKWREKLRFRGLEMDNVDHLSPREFEFYVAEVLKSQGFATTVTNASGDLGTDVVAEKDGVKWSVQCKRYSGGVDRRAVSDAVAAKAHYACDRAMVVTTGEFRAGAKQLAEATQCELVDRSSLADWVNSYRSINASQRPPTAVIAAGTVAICLSLFLMFVGYRTVSAALGPAGANLAQVFGPPSNNAGRPSPGNAAIEPRVVQLTSDMAKRDLTRSDLDGLPEYALTILRNTPYSRHGLRFKRSDLTAYFSQDSGYQPRYDDPSAVDDMLNTFERRNVKFIASLHERASRTH
jgi:hypothetical protein